MQTEERMRTGSMVVPISDLWLHEEPLVIILLRSVKYFGLMQSLKYV
jgi:hypothetical protein